MAYVNSLIVKVTGDPLLASDSMGNWRNVNYGQNLVPVTLTGAKNDNILDLGQADARWKDLHLSNNILIGATGAESVISSAGRLVIAANTNDSGTFQDLIFRAGSSANGNIIFETAGAEVMQIFKNGRIGIKASAASHNLDIWSADDYSARIYKDVSGIQSAGLVFGSFANINSAAIKGKTTAASTGELIFLVDESSSLTEKMILRSNGNLDLLATSPTLNFGADVNLYRSATNTLKTDDNFIVAGNLTIGSATFSNSGAVLTLDSSRILALGGELAPDAIAGGATFKSGVGRVFTLKQTGLAHGMTSIDETDTHFAQIGSLIRTYSAAVPTTAWQHGAYVVTEDTTTTTTSDACYVLNAAKKSGTTITSLSASGNIAVFDNGSVNAQIFKGNGDIFTNTDQTAGLAGFFDSEEDISLMRAAKYSMVGLKNNNLKKYQKRLQEIGVMQGSFVSHTKMMNLQLGAFDQLFNVVKCLAKKLNISEGELYEYAKNY